MSVRATSGSVRSRSTRPPLIKVILLRFFSKDWGKISLGLIGLATSAAVWIIGAKFTSDGILVLLNMLIAFIGIPWGFVIPPHYAIYCLIVPLPVVFSYTEWTKTPVYYDEDEAGWVRQPFGVMFMWALILIVDLGTNYAGVGVPSDLPLFWRQLVGFQPSRLAIAAVLTIAPEALARSMVAYIRSAW